MFKLYKGKVSNLLKDKIAVSFGFGTEKERLDYKIENYQRDDIYNINHIMAERNIVISELNSVLNSYDRVLNPMNEYLNLYKEIEETALEEITKNGSNVIFTLYKSDGTIFAKGSYSVLKETIKLEKNIDEVLFMVNELENLKEQNVPTLIDNLINNKGSFSTSKGEVSNYEIYQKFMRLEQLIEMNQISKSDGTPYAFAINNFNDAKLVKKSIEQERSSLELQKNRIKIQLNELNSRTAADQSTLDTIEASKKIIMASPQYMAAKASDEYIKEYWR